jgi:hypothetical protein
MPQRRSAKRELINTGTDKRYVRRDASGRFKESDDVGRAAVQDRKRPAKAKSTRGQATAATVNSVAARGDYREGDYVATGFANFTVSPVGSLVSRRSLLMSPTISTAPQLRHIVAFVITSPVSSVRNFDSWGRNDVRMPEYSAPRTVVSPLHR